MRKIISILVITYLLINECFSQNTHLTTKDTIEYFDIKSFEKDNKNRNTKNFYNDNGDHIQQFMSSGKKYFIERTEKKNSPITLVKVFHLNGSLHIQSTDFYEFKMGIRKEYNEAGKLIKEIDNDKNYPFKVDDLCKLIKEEYGVDLYIKSKVYKGEKYDVTIQNDVLRIYEEDFKKNVILLNSILHHYLMKETTMLVEKFV